MDKQTLMAELEQRQISLWEFSKLSGIAHATLHRIKTGKRPSRRTAVKVVKKCLSLTLKDFGYE